MIAYPLPDSGLAGTHLLGTRLASAAAQVLHAQGAGLSVSADPGMSWPLGASSPAAALAEQAEFTAGEGPSSQASAERLPVVADQDMITRCWPGFADALSVHTPFRSLLVTPLLPLGALHLYFTDPDGCDAADVNDTATVAQAILMALTGNEIVDALQVYPTSQSPWGRRSRVAVAIGMVNVTLELDDADALSLLRAFAFNAGQSVDQVADDLVTGDMNPRRLMF